MSTRLIRRTFESTSVRPDSGIYSLVLELERGRGIEVGSLGMLSLSRGYYVYTGSARGPGGLKRVDRHLQIIQGRREARRWHIDHLLPFTSLQVAFVTRTSRDLECIIARAIGESLEAVGGFGCSDCRCGSHLHYSPELGRACEAAIGAHRAASGADPEVYVARPSEI
ncbi:MAG: GIY-YIG nuclease family protein [Methanothrix sp.]|nr:GIY-YIG nuclease family protein [Methanothrix sp.]